MRGSKINQLKDSYFQGNRKNSGNQINNIRRQKSVLTQSKELDEVLEVDKKQMSQYLLLLPDCSYHHRPITHLCISANCKSTNYGLCDDLECRKLHETPDVDTIEIDKLNELIISNTASLLMLKDRIMRYFETLKEKINHLVEKNISKIQYIMDNVYINELVLLIKSKKHREITSKKFNKFIYKDIYQNNPVQRMKMESLKDEAHKRIIDLQKNLSNLAESKDFNNLLLNNLIKSNSDIGNIDYINEIEVKNFDSTIMTYREEFESVCKMLKQNRAPSFKKITTIFRASEHQFSAALYHQVIDGKSPTVIMIKTTANKKFGAFLNCKVYQNQNWICDATGLSFIFSLDRQETFRLKSQANSRIKAAFGGCQGPQIGSGCDIYIYDKCNKSRKNGANLGGSYRLPSHIEYNTLKARTYLAGEEFFQVEEYEVFLLE